MHLQNARSICDNQEELLFNLVVQDRICFFCGMVRELSGFAFLEALAPQWVTKKM
jgi:hypothetical protein